ncbi:hypothetical protein [Mesorhizobium sp. WSM3860]|uniref:hypothetical protein n=1 Tax=Mesorhizobium sp. WSM3860 TaxID=2029403 RepID=UPI000BAEBC12|nr:hypothetical protein [Mesorhizobium sp. WSM3860]PBC00777.1 hypothetical protein CK220_29400 [Mesorhizobium sp. WSM3860]
MTGYNVTRRRARTALSSLVAAASTSVIGQTASGVEVLDAYERVRRTADDLAASMQAVHGGSWSIVIDHKALVAAVSPHFGSRRS